MDKNIDIKQLLDGDDQQAQQTELLKVLALVGLTLEDFKNDPSIRELVSDVFEKFRNDGCSDDTAAFDLRMATVNRRSEG